MKVVIYSFVVKPNKEAEFIHAWSEVTKLIYKHAGSLGSRLHKESDNHFIAYAQWPDDETYDSASNKLPDSSMEVRKQMKDTCESIETLYDLKVVADLLADKAS